jgi:peptide deformylase
MLDTLYETQGVGLAATQVNVAKRIMVIDVSEAQNEPLVFINPEIIAKKDIIDWEEGCLSFPGVYAKVKRAKEVEVSFMDLDGKQQTLVATELLGICIQHELDHLNGITFYDHLSRMKQELIRNKLEKMRRKSL